eukprot:TRINITY_DN4489_c0_g1_i1.p1 TRINITY_DN4489_c0_g1~~TRINITY_DN4489_c0_g1_i1.p1  ORF type:complete len:258 (+),score=19.25 TRINITY_DN4489_c0_g1_i1:43-816(+)
MYKGPNPGDRTLPAPTAPEVEPRNGFPAVFNAPTTDVIAVRGVNKIGTRFFSRRNFPRVIVATRKILFESDEKGLLKKTVHYPDITKVLYTENPYCFGLILKNKDDPAVVWAHIQDPRNCKGDPWSIIICINNIRGYGFSLPALEVTKVANLEALWSMTNHKKGKSHVSPAEAYQKRTFSEKPVPRGPKTLQEKQDGHPAAVIEYPPGMSGELDINITKAAQELELVCQPSLLPESVLVSVTSLEAFCWLLPVSQTS